MTVAPIVMEFVPWPHPSNFLPTTRVNIFQRVVHTIGIPVKTLGTGWLINESIHGKERRYHGVVAAAVHINEAEGVEVLVASEAPVEHRLLKDGIVPKPFPCVGVAPVAPGIETEFLLNSALIVGDGSPICFTPYHIMVDLWAKIMDCLLLRKGSVTNLPTRDFDYIV